MTEIKGISNFGTPYYTDEPRYERKNGQWVDTKADTIAELEKIKAKIKEEEEKGIYYECEEWIEGRPCDEDYFFGLLRAIMIIDNHISELKGKTE